MNYENVLIENVSKDEAYKVFDSVRNTITDCNKTVVVVSGNVNNDDSGWGTTKININRFR